MTDPTDTTDPAAGDPPPAPDPGNSPPEEWSTDLDDHETDEAYHLVNEIVVDLPDLPADGA